MWVSCNGKKLIHINHFRPRSGRTWPSWPEVCRPQLQTSPVVLGQTGGAEHPRRRWRVRHPDYCHEVENCVSHLLLGGALPHHRGDGVQSAGAASREFPEAGHPCRKTGVLGHARLRKLLWAGGFGQGRWKHQHRINNSNLFCFLFGAPDLLDPCMGLRIVGMFGTQIQKRCCKSSLKISNWIEVKHKADKMKRVIRSFSITNVTMSVLLFMCTMNITVEWAVF